MIVNKSMKKLLQYILVGYKPTKYERYGAVT